MQTLRRAEGGVSQLLDLARKKWRSSGLTDEHAEKLGFKALSGAEVVALSGNFQMAGALYLPYWTAEGEPSSFYRIRYLESLPGFAAQIEKPQRYAQPKGTLNEVYMPPLFGQTWEEILADAKIPIYITEGELKAAAGCSLGLAVIGLGGVDVWRASKRGIDFLPTLAKAEWNRRPVISVYDSDMAQNANVLRAQRTLAQELLARGAIPQIASLPDAAGGGKQGLDDFLVANGADALLALLAEAPTFPEAQALWELNEEVVYIRDPGLIAVRNDGRKMAPAQFIQHAYANRHYLEVTMDKKGNTKSVKKPLAKRWMEWEQRFELQRVTYRPGEAKVVNGAWNEWSGWGTQPERGDVKPWQELLQFIFKDTPDAGRWFEMWCAYPLQHPGTKLFTSVVLWGIHHGTGKTLVGYTLRDIYGANATEISDKELHGSFNDWAKNKQFVIGNEVTGSDKRAESDRLKNTITQEVMRINAKYVPAYTVPDCVNYYFTSNHPDAFFLEDNDRRFFIHEVVGQPLPMEFYQRYEQWLKNGGASYLFYHLLHLDTTDFHPKATAMMTRSKISMIMDSKSDLGSWVIALRENPENTLAILGDKVSKKCDLFMNGQLLQVYSQGNPTKVTANGLGRELKRAGFRQVHKGSPVMTSHGTQRIWYVRNGHIWETAKPADIAKHFDSFWGTQKGY